MNRPLLLMRVLKLKSCGRNLLLLLTVALAPGQLRAAEYFVATNGNDSAVGSRPAPWATLNAANKRVQPGDTVFIRGGRYLLPAKQTIGVELSQSGKSGQLIRYLAYTNETPVLDGSALAGRGRIAGLLISGDWIHVKGLEVCNVPSRGTSYGIWIKDVSHTIVEQCRTHHHNGPGLFIDGGRGGHLILNCDSHDNYDPGSKTGAGQNADGFGCHYQEGGPPTIFRGCRAWWNSDDGFDWFKQEVPVIIENCWAMGAGYTPGGAESAKSGNGAGFKMGNTFTGVRHTIRNCVAIKNKAQGFYANHSHGGSDWFNNTAFENRGAAFDMLADVPLTGAKVHKLRNNVAYPGKLKNLAGADSKSNSWDLGVEPTEAEFQSVSDEGFLGPRQPNGDLPDLKFLKLRAGSQLIDKGEKVGLPFKDSAPDLGAYEFGQ
jgi:hypothetical protein